MQVEFSKGDFWRAFWAGELIALLALPVLENLSLLEALGGAFARRALVAAWLLLMPFAAGFGLYLVYRVLAPRFPVAFQLGKYGIVGILNTFMSLGIFNFLILISGVAVGLIVDGFAFIAFALTVTNSFFWNKYWIFDVDDSARIKSEYIKFFSVSGTIALFNLLLVHVWVNTLGAPSDFDPKLWANIIFVITIPISFFGNYFGYRIFVFRALR